MSSSKSQPEFDFDQAVMMINILRQTNMWETALLAAEKSSVQEHAMSRPSQSSGSMHDGSKRRAPSVPVDLDEDGEFEYIPGDASVTQAPIHPGGYTKGNDLPDGVTSLEQWGKTLCTLPKVASKKLTYAAMIKKSKWDDEMLSYLQWVMHSNMKSAKLDDLKAYLRKTGFEKENSDTVYFPGSKAVREFGS